MIRPRRKGMAADSRALLGVFLALILAGPAAPYQYPLSSTAIREAYFLGQRNDEKTREFLAQYVRMFPLPPKGPHVAAIGITTPYLQVVRHGLANGSGYSAQDAEEEFLGKPGSFLVTVTIYTTFTYSPNWLESKDGKHVMHPERLEFWRDFHVRLIQAAEIAPSKITGWPIYAAKRNTVGGAEVNLVFPAERIQSAPAEIDVETPNGAHVSVTFDLAKLQ